MKTVAYENQKSTHWNHVLNTMIPGTPIHWMWGTVDLPHPRRSAPKQCRIKGEQEILAPWT